jgi:hypothetical protein
MRSRGFRQGLDPAGHHLRYRTFCCDVVLELRGDVGVADAVTREHHLLAQTEDAVLLHVIQGTVQVGDGLLGIYCIGRRPEIMKEAKTTMRQSTLQ